MSKLLTWGLFAATVVVAVGVYQVKIDARRMSAKIVELKKEIEKERDTISILRAEWSLLNQPLRVQGLSDRHLDLKRTDSTQYAPLSTLPRKPLAPVVAPLEIDDERADITGSLPQLDTPVQHLDVMVPLQKPFRSVTSGAR